MQESFLKLQIKMLINNQDKHQMAPSSSRSLSITNWFDNVFFKHELGSVSVWDLMAFRAIFRVFPAVILHLKQVPICFSCWGELLRRCFCSEAPEMFCGWQKMFLDPDWIHPVTESVTTLMSQSVSCHVDSGLSQQQVQLIQTQKCLNSERLL